jgi:hypothetical protein
MQTNVASILSTVFEGDARLIHYSRCWAAHRVITEFMVKLFADFDIGNSIAAEALKQSGMFTIHAPQMMSRCCLSTIVRLFFFGDDVVHCVRLCPSGFTYVV